MPDLTTPVPEESRPGLLGTVTTAPATTADAFTVTVPGFSEAHFYEIHHWQSRGSKLPAVGDEVLVVFDDKENPWVPAWWPATGDDPEAPNVKGFKRHDEDPHVPRPGGFASVEWNGIVEPLNAIDTDTWVNPGRP